MRLCLSPWSSHLLQTTAPPKRLAAAAMCAHRKDTAEALRSQPHADAGPASGRGHDHLRGHTRGCERPGPEHQCGLDLARQTAGALTPCSLPTYLPCPFWRKANNFRGLFVFLLYDVATINIAYIKIVLDYNLYMC